MGFIDWIVANVLGIFNALAITLPIGTAYWTNQELTQRRWPTAARYVVTGLSVLIMLAVLSLTARLFAFPSWMPHFS